MGEEPVEQEEASGAAGNRAADAGQVVELTERSGERRLASLVRSGHYEDALWTVQAEIVSDDRLALRDQFLRERQVEGVGGEDLFRGGSDLRIAEIESGRS